MTRFQRNFINQLVGNVKKDLLQSEIPAAWDGIELRWLIADKFAETVVTRSMGDLSRKRAYNNYRLVHNL